MPSSWPKPCETPPSPVAKPSSPDACPSVFTPRPHPRSPESSASPCFKPKLLRLVVGWLCSRFGRGSRFFHHCCYFLLHSFLHRFHMPSQHGHHRLHGFRHNLRHFLQKLLSRRRRIECRHRIHVAFRQMLLINGNHALDHVIPRERSHGIVHHLGHSRFEIGRQFVFVLLKLFVDHLVHWFHHRFHHLPHHLPRMSDFQISLDILLRCRGIVRVLLGNCSQAESQANRQDNKSPLHGTPPLGSSNLAYME